MSSTEEYDKKEMEYWRADVAKVSDDATHGSVFLANQAINIVEDFVERQMYKNRTELIQALSKLSNALIRAKPLMALIFNQTKAVLDFIQDIPREQKDIDIIKQQTMEEIQRLRETSKKNVEVVTRWGCRLILDHQTILTHSASSLVESILITAKKQKRRFRVICTESRPLNEGRDMAQRLAKAGVKVRLITDADVARAVDDCNFILTGTDRFTETTFINKTGTHAIATLAQEMNKPLYVVGESGKILLKRTYPVRFSSNNPDQLLAKPQDNLQVQNIYFEETPIQHADKVVIEDGVYELKEFIDRYL